MPGAFPVNQPDEPDAGPQFLPVQPGALPGFPMLHFGRGRGGRLGLGMARGGRRGAARGRGAGRGTGPEIE